jgi:hypothetical protein
MKYPYVCALLILGVAVVVLCVMLKGKTGMYQTRRINPYIEECDVVDVLCRNDISKYHSWMFSKKPSLHLVSCGTDVNRGKNLVNSAKRHGLKFHMGCGHIDKWCGFGEKFKFLDQYIKKNKVPDYDIIIMIDAYDAVLLNTTEDEIIQRVKSLGKPLFTSAGLYHWPPRKDGFVDRWDRMVKKSQIKSPYKYVCSGVSGGRVKELKEFVKESLKVPCKDLDDQEFWEDYAEKHPDKVHVDHQCVVSVSTGTIQDNIQWSGKTPRVLVKPTHTTPPILHVEVNNGHKSDWKAITKYLSEKYPV